MVIIFSILFASIQFNAKKKQEEKKEKKDKKDKKEEKEKKEKKEEKKEKKEKKKTFGFLKKSRGNLNKIDFQISGPSHFKKGDNESGSTLRESMNDTNNSEQNRKNLKSSSIAMSPKGNPNYPMPDESVVNKMFEDIVVVRKKIFIYLFIQTLFFFPLHSFFFESLSNQRTKLV